MKWPLVEKSSSSPAAEQSGDTSGQPAGIERSRGEGGFYARIVAQDKNRPWRYAFIQQERSIDSTGNSDQTIAGKDAQFIGVGNTNVPFGMPTLTETGTAGTVTIQGYTGPPGEMSMWNGNGNGPFQIVNKLIASGDDEGKVQRVSLAQLDIKNWAEEVNGNQSVPLGMIVWLRRHESYIEPTGNTLRDDYTFAYQQPIWAKITGPHKVNSDDPCCDSQYAWQEVIRNPFNGTDAPAVEAWGMIGTLGLPLRCSQPNAGATSSDGSTDTPIVGTLTYPAREVNGNISVPIGQTVQLIPGRILKFNDDGTISDQEWLFQCDDGPEWFYAYLSGSASTGGTINPPTFTLLHSTRNIKLAGDNSGIEVFRAGVYLVDVWACVGGTMTMDALNAAGGNAATLQNELQTLNSAFASPPFTTPWMPTVPWIAPFWLTVSGGTADFNEVTAHGIFGQFKGDSQGASFSAPANELGCASITMMMIVNNNSMTIAQSGYEKVTVRLDTNSYITDFAISAWEPSHELPNSVIRIARIANLYNHQNAIAGGPPPGS